jgi:hypothetical protein
MASDAERDDHAAHDEDPLKQKLANQAIPDEQLCADCEISGQRRPPFEKIAIRAIARQERRRLGQQVQIRIEDLRPDREHKNSTREYRNQCQPGAPAAA